MAFEILDLFCGECRGRSACTHVYIPSDLAPVSSVNMRRLPQFVRLASVSRPSRVRLASVVLSRVGRPVSRRSSCASRVGRPVSRRSSCLACVSRLSVCVSRASHVCLSASASVVLSRVCLASRVRLRRSVLVNACGNWLILCVGRHSKSLKGFCYRHTIAVHIDYVDYMNRPLIF